MNELQTLLYMSLGGTALACILLLMQRLVGKKLPSAFYYYAWLLVLLRFVLPIPGLMPTVQSQTQTQESVVRAETTAVTTTVQTMPQTAVPSASTVEPVTHTYTAADTDDFQTEITTSAQAGADRTLRLAEVRSHITKAVKSPNFWTGLWLIGAVLCALWYTLCYFRFSRALRRVLLSPRWSDQQIYQSFSLRRRPRLARCRCVDTPMLLGLFHPLIVIPDRDYDPVTLKNILRHELTHHRRGDIAYKWFAVLVFSLHWFNPLTYLFRRELDRVCELSCDEQLLKTMTAGEKQNYGETLIDLAAERPILHRVVATTFATEKRTLKERLVQIMTYKHQGKKTLILVLAAVLILCASGAVMGPRFATQAAAVQDTPDTADIQPTPEPQEAPADVQNTTTVTTVDEFLAAIAPNKLIVLKPGTYDLSTASDYGEEHPDGWYTWEDVSDGYKLVIQNVSGLTILGSSVDEVTIAAVPRYADVITFRDCQNIALTHLTAGHTEEPTICSGGVINLTRSSDALIQDTSLYGCGILAVSAYDSSNISVLDSELYECSMGAVAASGTMNLRIENCGIHDCGENNVLALFSIRNCKGVSILNNRIYNNQTSEMVLASSVSIMYFMGNDVRENNFGALFSADLYSPVVADCSFQDNQFTSVYDGALFAVSPEGQELTQSDLATMTLAQATYDVDTMTYHALSTPSASNTIQPAGSTEITVSTVDELLAAIAPNTTIYLEPGEYNLFESSYYGIDVNDYCTWVEVTLNNYGLVITGAENLTIIGSGADNTQIITNPRVVDVISFQTCDNLTLEGFTAGHSIILNSECSGDVLSFYDSTDITISDCGLFGCGVWGIRAGDCSNISVTGTEIYDCSGGGLNLTYCQDVSLIDCDIHDCSGPDFTLVGCANITRDGESVS